MQTSWPCPTHFGGAGTRIPPESPRPPTRLPSQRALPGSRSVCQRYYGHRYSVPVRTMIARGTHKNPSSTIPLNLWPWLIVTCEQRSGKHVVQAPRSPASCLCSASMEGRGGGKEERELFNPPQRNSPLNPYRELTGKSRCWKAHHTHTAVFLISSAERNLYSALESDCAAARSELYDTPECKQVPHSTVA